MGNAVLISNKPKWCELIAIGQKKWELRKTKPKLKPPFKVYIYETKEKAFADIGIYGKTKDGVRYNFVHRIGKVIGEFICDEIREVYQCNSGWVAENACVMRREFFDYLGIPQDTHFGYDKKAYAWHITDLKIYDEPKELGEFYNLCPKGFNDETNYACYRERGLKLRFCKYSKNGKCDSKLKRPPQSWCYVEDLESVSR